MKGKVISNTTPQRKVSSVRASKLIPNVQPEWIVSIQKRLSELEKRLVPIQEPNF